MTGDFLTKSQRHKFRCDHMSLLVIQQFSEGKKKRIQIIMNNSNILKNRLTLRYSDLSRYGGPQALNSGSLSDFMKLPLRGIFF